MSSWSIEDLHRKLDVALGDDPAAMRRTLRVERIARHGAALELDVVVSDPAAHVDGQRWRLSFPSLWDDIARLPLDGARIVTRANIEEWWDTRHHGEPQVNLVARRLSEPSRRPPEPEVASVVSRLIDDSGIGTQAGRLRVS